MYTVYFSPLTTSQVCSELCDPSLCPSEEEEKEEFLRAKKAFKLIKVNHF